MAGFWDRDGSLRDIYVHDTTATHWERFDRLLIQYKCTYSFDGKIAIFPGSCSALISREGSHLLSIVLDGAVDICCHFFSREQLELDISPGEVTGPLQHDQVLSFVEHLAGALGLAADITPEDTAREPTLTYSPETKSWRLHGKPQ